METMTPFGLTMQQPTCRGGGRVRIGGERASVVVGRKRETAALETALLVEQHYEKRKSSGGEQCCFSKKTASCTVHTAESATKTRREERYNNRTFGAKTETVVKKRRDKHRSALHRAAE